MAILYFKKQNIFKFIIIKNRRINYFRKALIINGYYKKLKIKDIFTIFAAKAVLGGQGIKFITIAIGIIIIITI